MKRLATVAALLTLAAATACSSSGSGDKPTAGEGGSGGVYTTIDGLKPGIDANAPINPYNPKGNTFRGYNTMRLAWQKNHLTDPTQFYPGIAATWEIAPDQSEITLHLQPNAKWSDGKPVTTEDVKMSLGLKYTQGGTAFALDPGAGGTASEIEIIDDKTIKISQTAETPSSTFAEDIMNVGILPAHVWGELLPDDFWETLEIAKGDDEAGKKAREEIGDLADEVIEFAPEKDVSAGPFVLKRVNPGEALLVKNKHFFNAAKVGPDQVRILNYTGNEQIWNYLIAGKLDSAPFTAVPANVMTRIEATKGNEVRKGYSPVVAGLAFNQSKAPYGDVHVRRALAYLIDRDQVVKVASPEGGAAPITTSGIHSKAAPEWLSPDALAALEPYAHDPAKAEAELTEAGLKKGGDGKWLLENGKPWKVTIHVPAPFSDWVTAAQSVSSQLKDFGIDAEVVTAADYPIYLEELAAGKYDLGFWLIGLGPSPYDIFQRLYGVSNGWQVLAGKLKHFAPGEDGNWMGGPETVEVEGVGEINPGELTAQLKTATGEEQKEIIAQLAKAANQNLPAIQMWDYVNTQFVNTSRFTDFPPDDSEALRLTAGVWMQLGFIKKK